jgi:hypothetical protein
MSRRDDFEHGATEHEPHFSTDEDYTLHVGGRPFRMAQPRVFPEDLHQAGFRGWSIPFESGHELHVHGRFKESGEPLFGRGRLGASGVIHAPSKTMMDWEGNEAKSDFEPGKGVETSGEFHDLIRTVSQWAGGGKGRRVS